MANCCLCETRVRMVLVTLPNDLVTGLRLGLFAEGSWIERLLVVMS